MKRNNIVEYISELGGIPKYQVLDILKDISEYIIDKLTNTNEEIYVPYIGSFEMKYRKGRKYKDNFGDGSLKKHPDKYAANFKMLRKIRLITKEIE